MKHLTVRMGFSSLEVQFCAAWVCILRPRFWKSSFPRLVRAGWDRNWREV